MSELWIVLQREFVARVRSRSFVVSTLLTPLFLSLFVLVPALTGGASPDEEPRLAVVDESRAGIGDAVALAMAAPGAEPVAVEVLQRPWSAVEDSLTLLVAGSALDGVLRVPAEVLDLGSASYLARGAAATPLDVRLSLALSAAVTQARLRRAGVSPALAARLFAPTRIVTTPVADAAAPTPAEEGGFLFALMTGFVLYFLILLYGVQVLHSVQEEKNNRIAEVLVSSMKASHLMLGKVFGVGLAALLQLSVWALIALLLATKRERLTEILGPPPDLLEALRPPADPFVGVTMLAFAVLGFFLYASLFAAAGAAAASSEDAQRFTLPLIAPLLLPVFVSEAIVGTPNGSLATILGWFPLTSPVVMPMRMGAGALDAAEIAGAFVVLMIAVYALGALAGKIYRVGILSTGKRPSMRELARWVRAA